MAGGLPLYNRALPESGRVINIVIYELPDRQVLVDGLLFKIQGKYMIKHKQQIDMLPNIECDYIIPVGAACRPAYWLGRCGLRTASLPFDWMMNFDFDMVLHTIDNGLNDWFTDFSDEPDGDGTHRKVTSKKYGIISLHAFPKGMTVKDYIPTFNTVFTRKYTRMLNVLRSKKHICFLCNRSLEPADFKKFGIEIMKRFKHIQNLTFINIKNTDNNTGINKYKLNSKIILYDIRAQDIHKNGSDPATNPDSWIGNEDLWNDICNHIKLRKPFAFMQRIFSVNCQNAYSRTVRLLGFKITLTNKQYKHMLKIIDLHQQQIQSLQKQIDQLCKKYK